MKYFSMFTGVGGFELGIQRALNNQYAAEKPSLCVGFSEINKYASELLKQKFPEVHNYGDATKINAEELPDFDLLVGGFPCQAFSIAGNRRGFEDTRGTLFFDIARIIKVKQPRLFVLENVKGLLNHNKGETFTTILSTLDELGYDAEWQVLNSKYFGVPQNRERVYVVGHLRGTPRPEVFPLGQSNEMGGSENQTANTLTANYWKGAAANRPIPTDGERIRKLTPLECERLQGFPDGWTEEFSDTQRYKMMGNAVTVNVVQIIFEIIGSNIK